MLASSILLALYACCHVHHLSVFKYPPLCVPSTIAISPPNTFGKGCQLCKSLITTKCNYSPQRLKRNGVFRETQ
jgi:hypothetical protein